MAKTQKAAKKEKKSSPKTKQSAHLSAVDLRAKTPDELKDMVLSFKKEQFNSRFQKVAGETQKPSRSRAVRKNIARIKTIMNEAQNSTTNTKVSKNA